MKNPSAASLGTIREAGTSRSGINLGGIGTGGVEIWPDGRFHHWNIANNIPWTGFHGHDHAVPAVKEANAGDTDFFIRVQGKGETPQFRWLFTGNGDMISTASHFFRHHKYYFIHSYPEIEYSAEYPFVHLRYLDEKFPVEVSLTAWSAFLPRNARDSSLPGFYLDFDLVNKSKQALDVSLVWQQRNFAGFSAGKVRQEHEKAKFGKGQGILMRGSLDETEHPSSGEMAIWYEPQKGQKLTSIAGNPYMQNIVWSIVRDGHLEGDLLPKWITREELRNPPSEEVVNKGWLCLQESLKAQGVTRMHAGMAWYFPNHVGPNGDRLGHVYSTWFAGVTEVASHLVKNRARFHDASSLLPCELMGSDLPEALKLSLLDQLSTLTKSTHYVEDGRFGLQEGHGCCAFNTMDVDHYSSYALSLLQPELRENVLHLHTGLAHPKNGKIHHGLSGSMTQPEITEETTEGYNRWDCSCQYVLQLFRDTRATGNQALMAQCLPAARRALELIASMDYYDIGLPYIEGGITYDHWRMKGVVTYMAGVYLAALQALESMALTLEDTASAQWAREHFTKGLKGFEEHLWDGDKYVLYYRRQPKGTSYAYVRDEHEGHLDPQKPSDYLEALADCGCEDGCCERDPVWEPLTDDGVMTDIINGHSTADVLGLGGFLKSDRVRKTLKRVLDNNWQPEHLAVVNGSYPDGHFLDEFPYMQWQTPWTGTEYFLALSCYRAGMTKEGDRIVEEVLQRHLREGMRFDQAECNNHYARPLVLWGAYQARTGLLYDGWEKALQFLPPGRSKSYSGAAILAVGLGRAQLDMGSLELEWLDGKLPLKSIQLPAPKDAEKVVVFAAGKRTAAECNISRGVATVTLVKQVSLKAGDKLKVTLS